MNHTVRGFRPAALGVALLLIFGILQTLLASTASAATAAQLTRYPYLTDATQSSTTVNWATDTTGGTAGSVTYGPAGGTCATSTVTATKVNITVISKAEYQWKAVLPTSPDTRYCYRVKLGSVDLLATDASPQFTSMVAAGASTPYSFAVFGDWGQAYTNGVNADQTNVLSQIAQSGARFAVMTGDTAYPGGSQKEYGDLQQLGADQSTVFAPTFWGVPGRSIPVFNVTGNHGFTNGANQVTNWPEQNTAAASGGKYAMEAYPSVNGSNPGTYPSMWYAFDAGPARFYILTAAWADGNLGTGSVYANDYAAHWTTSSPEYKWLQSDLAAHPNAVKFAFWHYPLYADSSGQPSDTFLQGPSSLQGLLNQNNVSVAFNGHAHGYERNKPDSSGMVSYVLGNGGAALGSISGCNSFDAYAIGSSSSHCNTTGVTNPEVFGFAKVTVNGRQITVTPTSSTGRTYDSQTYTAPVAETDSTPPSPPTGVTGQAVSTSKITLSWTAATDNVGVTGYRITRDDGSGTPVTKEQPGTGTTYTDDTVGPGASYSYTVTAIDAAGNVSTPSAPPTVVTTTGAPDGTPPSQPGNLTASASAGNMVNLTWTASTDNVGVVDYKVYRNNTVISQPTPPNSTPPTTYSDDTASPSTTYTYAVTAVDAAGNESTKAATTVTTPAGGTPDTTPPTAPGNLTATAASATQVDLSWTASTDNVGVSSYQITRSGLPTPIVVPGTATSYSDTGLTASTAYTYSVVAVDAAGNASPPATASATTPAAGGSGGTFTFTPTDDAYVDSSVPTTNFATNARLTVDNSPQVNSLLKFNLAALPAGCTVTSAKLQLTVGTGTDDKSPYGGDLYGSTNTSWTQSTVNWNNQPAAATTKTSSVATAVALSTAYTWDAKPLITGNGLLSMVLKSTSGDGARYYSIEGAGANTALKPTLTVTCSGGGGTTDTTPPSTPTGLTATAAGTSQINLSWTASTDNVGVAGYRVFRDGGATAVGSPTGTTYSDTGLAAGSSHTYTVEAVDAAGNLSGASTSASATTATSGGTPVTVTLNPTADSYTDSTSTLTNTNFGTGARLTVDNSPVSYTWLTFNVTGLNAGCTVSAASLKLTIGSTTNDNSPYGGDLYGTTGGTSFIESGAGGITWANQPTSSINPTKTSSVATTVALNGTYTWDAKPLVTGNGTVTLVLKSTSSDGARYLSRESTTNNALKPTLTVTCG